MGHGSHEVYYANTHTDAAHVGFDDAFIYEEINLDPSQRKIPMIHLPQQQALDVFKMWIEKTDKVKY